MRFLANENIPAAVVKALKDAGHDVAWVRAVAPGISDSEVLVWAVREERILLTFDKDFGELARGARLKAPCGVVLFRIPMPPPGRRRLPVSGDDCGAIGLERILLRH